MRLDQARLDGFQRRVDGLALDQHVFQLALVLQHAADALDLADDAVELLDLVLVADMRVFGAALLLGFHIPLLDNDDAGIGYMPGGSKGLYLPALRRKWWSIGESNS